MLKSPKWSLPFRFSPKTLYVFLISLMRVIRPAHLIRLDFKNTRMRIYITKLLTAEVSSDSCKIRPLGSKYSPQHPTLKWSRDSAVGIATGYGLDDQGVRVRVPVGSRIFSSPSRPDRLWDPPNLSNGYWGLFPRG
jgi:hypothetical protein